MAPREHRARGRRGRGSVVRIVLSQTASIALMPCLQEPLVPTHHQAGTRSANRSQRQDSGPSGEEAGPHLAAQARRRLVVRGVRLGARTRGQELGLAQVSSVLNRQPAPVPPRSVVAGCSGNLLRDSVVRPMVRVQPCFIVFCHSTACNMAATDANAVAQVTNGSTIPFTAFSEKDPTNNSNLQYQSITAMPQYRSTSFEVCGTPCASPSLCSYA